MCYYWELLSYFAQDVSYFDALSRLRHHALKTFENLSF